MLCCINGYKRGTGRGKERGMIYRKKVENKCCGPGKRVVECVDIGRKPKFFDIAVWR